MFVVTKSSSSDSAALNANTQCFKSRPVKIWVGRIHSGPLLSVSAPFLQFRQLHYNKCLGTHFNLTPIPDHDGMGMNPIASLLLASFLNKGIEDLGESGLSRDEHVSLYDNPK